ncbi:MAG TPA: transglutaminase domain-containing protein [Draconibacterium sp.]|nr:transglutaminase domain-containing protein [Draconibacterium sp.]
MNKLILLVIISLGFWSCQSKYPGVPESYHVLLDSAFVNAGENVTEIQKALNEAPKDQKEGMAFIISYMPKRDLTSLSAAFLLENSEYAYKAREKYAWCAALPDSIFFNEVLPYANISETRDPWRKDFYERFSKYVDDKDNIVDAIFAIARPINKEVNVEYNTKRSKVDSSPKEAMAENMATCTGLSIILTDAFRSVGIPSRLAGTAMWTNFKGNHTWSEVWVDNQWQFIEYYPDTLNKSWFLADAGKADPNNMLHWIYATSYKPTGMPYYAGVSSNDILDVVDLNTLPEPMKGRFERMKSRSAERKQEEPYIWGVNVTKRYIDLYQESLKNNKLNDDELIADFVVFKDSDTSKSESRLDCRVDIFEGDNLIDFGYSPRKTDDMNLFLKVKLKKETNYKAVVSNPAENINQSFEIKTGNEPGDEFKLVLKNE